jgi:hypothetical protein
MRKNILEPSSWWRPGDGPRAYAEPDDSADGREYVIKRGSFWRDESERLTYEHAVEVNPRKPDEGVMTYVARVAVFAQAKLALLPSVVRL